MNDLIIKNVNVLGDSILAAKDSKGNIWSELTCFLPGIGYEQKAKGLASEESAR